MVDGGGGAVGGSGPTVESVVERVAGMSLLGAGAVHAAFVGPYLDEGVAQGGYFAVVTVVQVVTGLALCLRNDRRLLGAAATFSVVVLGVWVVRHTIGIGGAAESLGWAGAVGAGLAAVVVAGWVAVVAAGADRRPVAPAVAGVTFGAVAVAVAALAVPSVAVGPTVDERAQASAAAPA